MKYPIRSPALRGPRLICPKDFTRLEVDTGDDSYRCPDCRVRYAVDGGVVRFIDREDIFFKSAYSSRVKFVNLFRIISVFASIGQYNPDHL